MSPITTAPPAPTARISSDEVPVLHTPNTAKPTPPAQFVAQIRAAISGESKDHP